ncbi:MAG TPA: c-type cytochrome [Candidatus Baltobacteraceae bacterium]|nr:c-type cytochrome [Candidatus Baltobacteraceae bacterium]
MFVACRPLAVAWAIAGAVLCACSPAVTAKSSANAGTAATIGGDAKTGAQIFAKNCSACHGATGVEGGTIGPSLRDEKTRMDYNGTVSWIEDPEPPMPKLYPQSLTQAQVRDVAAYVQSL